MDNNRTLLEIKAELQNIGQSLYHISKDIHTLLVKILKENEKNDK